MRKKYLWIFLLVLLIIFIFSPAPTAEIAVRKDLFFSFHPIKSLSNSIHEGKVKNDPKYGDLYEVDGIELSFMYVKKSAWGWRVTSRGTAP